MSAASLQTLAMSAPEKPGVWRARNERSSCGSSLSGRRWTSKISLRSLTSGSPTSIWRSNRPARVSALSRMSTRLVAASTMTPVLVWKPSISVSSWLSVFSRSSLPEKPAFLPRARPMASISSMKTMQGAFCLACSKRSRTREAPTPTNISTKSEPEIERKGTLASPATALASSVLPVPGGPTRRAPFGILAPSSRYLSAFLRKSTISMISTFASARPATSLKVTRLALSLSKTWALALPTFMMPPPAPPPPRAIERMRKIHTPMISTHGRTFTRMLVQLLRWVSYTTGISVPVRCSTSFKSSRKESTEPMVKMS